MSSHVGLWKFVQASLEQQVPVMLLYVVESQGSSPGRQGFAMVVNRSGETKGSIGGGIMEHKFVEMAKEKLSHDWYGSSVHRQIHNKETAKHQSGMICSGEQTNVLYRLQQADLAVVKQVVDCLAHDKNGRLSFSPGGLLFSAADKPDKKYSYQQLPAGEWGYEERIGLTNQLHIVGGGHCALALSRLMRMMDFYIHLYEDRPELNTFDENNFAQHKQVVNSYSDLADLVEEGEEVYVIIMTFGYRTDDIALRALINKQFRYLGILGSKNKIAKMFETYQAEGFSNEQLGRIFAPAGLPIHSQTPEEIAVSIAAQIIAVKHALGGR
jgi:xanthine dehydrogenase accessory factor